MAKGPFWSEQDKQLLKLLFDRGMSDVELSKILGRPESGIRGERLRDGLVRRVLPKVKPVKIVELAKPARDSLPDVGELLVKISNTLTRIERLLDETNVGVLGIQSKQYDTCRACEATADVLTRLADAKGSNSPKVP
jgi:hypothetical protein